MTKMLATAALTIALLMGSASTAHADTLSHQDKAKVFYCLRHSGKAAFLRGDCRIEVLDAAYAAR